MRLLGCLGVSSKFDKGGPDGYFEPPRMVVCKKVLRKDLPYFP